MATDFASLFGTSGNYSPDFSFLSSPEQTEDDKRRQAEAKAKSMGGQIIGGRVMMPGPAGIPSYTPLGSFYSKSSGGALGQLGQAFKKDYENQYAAGQEDRGKAMGILQQMAAASGRAQGIAGLGERTAGDLEKLGKTAGGFEQFISGMQANGPLAGVNKDLEGLYGQADSAAARMSGNVDATLNTELGAAYGAGDRAEKTASGNVDYLKSTGENQIGAQVAAMRQNMSDTKAQIARGLNPDGTMMTQEERMAASADMQAKVEVQTGAIIAQAHSDLRNQISDATQKLAQVQLGVGQLHEQGAGLRLEGEQLKGQFEAQRQGVHEFGTQLRSQVGLQQSGMELQARESMASLQASLGQAAASIRNASYATGLQYEMQGLQGMAQILQMFPNSVPSYAAALAAMLEMSTAPGAQNVDAFGGFQ